MKINLVVYVLFFYIDASVVSFVVLSYVSIILFTKGKFLTNSFIQSKVNIIYSDISWASSIKT